jgi:ribonuclease HI
MLVKKAKIFIDGGSRGNPGHGACAAVIFNEKGELVHEEGRYLGRCTNNFAEYNGLILALATARRLGALEAAVFSDSELLVKQFSGEYRIKDPVLRGLMAEVRKEAAALTSVTVSHVRREANVHADRLVNVILDNAGTMKDPSLARSIAKENSLKLSQPKLF